MKAMSRDFFSQNLVSDLKKEDFSLIFSLALALMKLLMLMDLNFLIAILIDDVSLSIDMKAMSRDFFFQNLVSDSEKEDFSLIFSLALTLMKLLMLMDLNFLIAILTDDVFFSMKT